MIKFAARIFGEVFRLRVFRFFGEALRQAGVLILGSTLVIWSLAFILGLQCGIEGAYFNRSVGAPAYAGVFSAWCDLREIIPYAFGYMMSAKVGTGLVAEIGAPMVACGSGTDATSLNGPWNGTHGSEATQPATHLSSHPAGSPSSGNPIHTRARRHSGSATTVWPGSGAAPVLFH